MTECKQKVSALAWTRADYEASEQEVPDKLLEDDLHTEGELLTREEIDCWVTDTYKTFCVLGEQKPETFNKLYDEFTLDVHYLLELGKIDKAEATALLNKTNFCL